MSYNLPIRDREKNISMKGKMTKSKKKKHKNN